MIKKFKNLLKFIVFAIVCLVLVAGVYLVQAKIYDKKHENVLAETSQTENGLNKNGSKSQLNGNNGSGKGTNSSSNFGNNQSNNSEINNDGNLENGMLDIGNENGSNSGLNNGSKSSSIINNVTNSSSINTGKIKTGLKNLWEKTKATVKYGIESFKEGYHSVPNYNEYNFDMSILLFEGDQYYDGVEAVLQKLIENSDDPFYSKPSLTYNGNTITYNNNPAEYSSAIQGVLNSLDRSGMYKISFGYTKFPAVVNEVIIER